MSRQQHIQGLRDSIARIQDKIDAMYDSCEGDVGDICRMEYGSWELDELRRQQRIRRDQLERLLKKEQK